MRERRGHIGHSLILACALLAGCMGEEEERWEIAYGSVRDEAPTRIVVVEDDGTDASRVTGARFRANPVLPTWSPDGRRLAFVRFRLAGGPTTLETSVVNADGSGERPLAEGTLPKWTNDGRFLLVERPRRPPQSSTIHVLSVDRAGERRLTIGSAPAVSHRGSRVAFVRHTYRRRADGEYVVATSSLYTISLDGTGLRRLAHTKRPDTRFTQPEWLPDDSAVAMIERRGGLGGPLVTVSPGRRRVVVPTVGETYDWSPRGDLVAYTHDGILFIIRPDGTEVTSFGQSNAIDIEWSPDGRRVAYSIQEMLEAGQFVGLYVVEFDEEEGKRRRFALADGYAAYLDWRPKPDQP